MHSSVLLKQSLWCAPCAALAAMALTTVATPSQAHDRVSSNAGWHGQQHQHALFHTRKDWELRNLHRRRAIVRSASRCMRRAQSTRALKRCEHNFDQALSDFRHDRARALRKERLKRWTHRHNARWNDPTGRNYGGAVKRQPSVTRTRVASHAARTSGNSLFMALSQGQEVRVDIKLVAAVANDVVAELL